MRISPLGPGAPRFEGYAACPLKRVYLQPHNMWDTATFDEMRAIGRREGFEVLAQTGNKVHKTRATMPRLEDEEDTYNDTVWGQDNKFFQKTTRGVVIKLLNLIYPGQEGVVRALGQAMNIPVRSARAALEGGNFFLGKRADGSPYALVGRLSQEKTAWMLCLNEFGVKKYKTQSELDEAIRERVAEKFKQERERYDAAAHGLIAREFGLKPEQVHLISQPDFHIDMGIRPLAGNRVLLNDPALSFELLSEAWQRTRNPWFRSQIKHLRGALHRYLAYQQRKNYADTETLAKELTAAGFEVIRMPGNFKLATRTEEDKPAAQKYRNACFTNALVHQRDNGELVYITNKSYLPIVNQLFERELKARAPEIKQVDWVSGFEFKPPDAPFRTNVISTALDLGGGIHCQAAEEPDFDRWGWPIKHL